MTVLHPDSAKLKIPGERKSAGISTFRACIFFLVWDAKIFIKLKCSLTHHSIFSELLCQTSLKVLLLKFGWPARLHFLSPLAQPPISQITLVLQSNYGTVENKNWVKYMGPVLWYKKFGGFYIKQTACSPWKHNLLEIFTSKTSKCYQISTFQPSFLGHFSVGPN